MSQRAPVPSFLYGTAWKEEQSGHLTKLAISAGFRGIDSANQRKHYFEAAVGNAVQAVLAGGALSRSDIFLQTKFTFRDGQDERLPYDPTASIAVQVEQSFQSSLRHFGTDYLDSLLLHGPSTRGKLGRADVEAWRAIEGLCATGKVTYAGVSNFTREQLEELCGLARIKPRFVQNRCYARSGWDREVRKLCAEQGIIYQAFSLLTANQRELQTPAVQTLAKKLGCSRAQLVFRFALEVGMLPLTGTSSLEHMRSDLDAPGFTLEPSDVRLLEALAG
jgi:diketogulonate reductase-like aldo/keto reductase